MTESAYELFFFFQAEDGIRDVAVTGVQTCALPISPVWTHYELAKRALENGKHVFVEKPFTSNSAQAEELIELAARKKLTIMVDHTFLFTGAVRKIRELTEAGTLGDLYYYDSLRSEEHTSELQSRLHLL